MSVTRNHSAFEFAFLSPVRVDATLYRYAIALASLVVAVELITYGLVAFAPIPHIDDWHYANLLFGYLDGRHGLEYLADRMTGHFAVPSHAFFAMSYLFANFDLAFVRWASALLLLAIACSFILVLQADEKRQGYGAQSFAGAKTALGALVALLLVASKTGWEQFSVAAAINSFACVLSVGAAIVCTDVWLSTKRIGFLIGAFALAALASVSYGTGALVWLCLVMQIVMDGRAEGRTRNVACGALLLAFAAFVVIYLGGGPAARAVGSGSLLAAPIYALAALGSAVAPQVAGHSSVTMHMVYGGLTCLFALVSVVLWLYGGQRHVGAKYLAFLLFGLANAALIAQSRQWLGLQGITASRYAVPLIPLVLGIVGLLVTTRRAKLMPIALCLAALGPPLAISSFEEHRMAFYRHENHELQIKTLHAAALPDRDGLRKTFYVGNEFIDLIAPVRTTMQEKKLAIFAK